MAKQNFKIGDRVAWTWGDAEAHGVVKEKFEKRVQRTISKTKVVRNATPENPAYLVEQDDQGKVLKSATELWKAK